MSVEDPTIGEWFTYTVKKYLLNAPETAWVNTYEFMSVGAVAYMDLAVLGSSLAQYEAALALNDTVVSEVRVGTWEPDSHPYNPANFATFTTELIGTRIAPGGESRLPLSACLHVRRDTQVGRPGKLFYRGVLQESDVQSAAGQWQMTTPAILSWASTMVAAREDSGLNAYIGGDATEGLVMSLLSNLGTPATGLTPFARLVTNLSPMGVASVRTKKRWYNRV